MAHRELLVSEADIDTLLGDFPFDGARALRRDCNVVAFPAHTPDPVAFTDADIRRSALSENAMDALDTLLGNCPIDLLTDEAWRILTAAAQISAVQHAMADLFGDCPQAEASDAAWRIFIAEAQRSALGPEAGPSATTH